MRFFLRFQHSDMALKPLATLFTSPSAPTTPTPQSSADTCQLPRMYTQPLQTPLWGVPIEENKYRDQLPWLKRK